MIKRYKIIGRHFTEQHGYLATRCQTVVAAKSEKEALKFAAQNNKNCNDFEIVESFKSNPHEQQLEKDYHEQQSRLSDDLEIKVQPLSRGK